VSANSASCPQGTADFFRGDKGGRGVKLTAQLYLVPEVKKKFDQQSHSLNVTPDTVLSLTKPNAHLSFHYGCKHNLVITVDQISPFPSIHATVSWRPCTTVYPTNTKMYISRLSPVSFTGPNKEGVKMLQHLLRTSANTFGIQDY